MPKVTFSTTPTVCVTVYGEGERGIPKALNDGGLISRLLKFISDEKLHTIIRGGMSGAGCYCGFHSAEDAAKIACWLVKQGAHRE